VLYEHINDHRDGITSNARLLHISTVPEVLSVVTPATSFAPSTTTNYATKKAAYFPNTIPYPKTSTIITSPRPPISPITSPPSDPPSQVQD
jgi:hypothetical protein